MSKHTPGPWTVFNSAEDGALDHHPGIDAGSEAIILCGDADDPNDWHGVRGDTIEEAHANARLIAAAPDMLAALEEFARRYEGFTNDELWRRSQLLIGGSLDYEFAIVARAAIAKAKGETP